jgi:hypothetical protein
MHDTQEVTAMKYAFVTNRALRAIACARARRPMPKHAPEALELAGKLLLEMRRGVAFAEGSQAQLGYSVESIPAANRAFGVIESLSMASRMSEVHALLEMFEANLERLRMDGGEINPNELDKLERFFRALNQSLTEEVSQATLGSALESPDNVGA